MALKGDKHGHKPRTGQSPTYISWNMMLARCYRPSSPSFKDYGARGITVCDDWRVFANFLADMGERPEGMSLDRINPSEGYGPSNCRWASRTTQNRNKRNVRRIEFEGQSLTLSEWADRIGVRRGTLAQRLYVYHWPVSKVLKESVSC